MMVVMVFRRAGLEGMLRVAAMRVGKAVANAV